MGRHKVIKPYRVSYYFADSADNGKVRLHTRIVRAYDVPDAKTQVINNFKGAPGGLVIVKAYHFYRTWNPPKRSTYIKVPAPTTFSSSTTSSSGQGVTVSTTLPRVVTVSSGGTTDLRGLPASRLPWDPFTPIEPFKGEIGPRPQGKCPQHPNSVLEADGRCPALDGYPLDPKFIADPAPIRVEPNLADIVAKVSGTLPLSDGGVCEDPATCGSSEHGACGVCAPAAPSYENPMDQDYPSEVIEILTVSRPSRKIWYVVGGIVLVAGGIVLYLYLTGFGLVN